MTRTIAGLARTPVPLALVPLFFLTPLAAQDAPEDPWFSTSDHGEAVAPESDDSVNLTGKSPAALYRLTMKRYKSIPEGNLSKRISALEEAIAVAPEKSDDARAELARLSQRKAAVLDAIGQASQTSASSISRAIALLAPYADALSADPTILVQLLESDFSNRLDSEVRALGETGDVEELVSISEQIDDTGLNIVFGERFDAIFRGSLASIVQSKWLDAASDHLPGEPFLLGRLLDNPNQRLKLGLTFSSDLDEGIRRNIARSLERRWGNDFQVLASESPQGRSDLLLRIELHEFDTERFVSEESVPSQIPGHITEAPNPEFMELAAKYEKAATRYAAALDAYETDYERYLDYMKNDEYDNAQRGLRQAEQVMEAARRTAMPTGPTPEYAAAQANLEIAQSLANSVSDPTPPEPVKPRPTHLLVLQELNLVPSTIVTSEEAEPYEYTRKTLEYAFVAQGELGLEAPGSDRIHIASPVALRQEKSWTQNEGVHARDPMADSGTFSEQELAATRNLFSLEFGSVCSKELEKLLGQARQSMESPDSSDKDLSEITLALSLKAQQQANPDLALSTEELKQLASLARTDNVSATAFRAKCLSLLAARLGQDPSLTAEEIESRLR